MIVWSKGLGKQRLPLELSAAGVRVGPDALVLEGTIEPVCWNYAIRLSPGDLSDFLALMAQPATAKLLARQSDILLPFVLRLVAAVPRLILKMILPQKADHATTG